MTHRGSFAPKPCTHSGDQPWDWGRWIGRNLSNWRSWAGWIIIWLFSMAAAQAQTAETPVVMTWDEGLTESGNQVFHQPSGEPGSYYFRISPKAAEVWRTRLTVTRGEAHLYLSKGQVPVIGQPGVRAAEAVGSDGIVVGPADFLPGENWFLRVEATGPNCQWNLVSGAAHVRDLGSLPFTDENHDGSYTIGEPSGNAGVTGIVIPPEGVLFFKTTLPVNVPAWALWLSGGQGVIGVRKSKVPVLFTANALADRKQNSSLLLVPPYLGQGSDSYFVGIQGIPGTTLSFNSQIQQVETMAFDTTVAPFSVSDSPYKVFRVDVPSGQIVWDVALERLAGDPSLAVKKETVPSETENDAFNEATGNVNDSLSIVAPALTNGTWYVTVYGNTPYETGLINGPPLISDIGYRDSVTNDQPDRVGWRYYRVPDFAAQAGTLGWELALANAPTGTEVAIRRAQIPGIWKKRSNGQTTATEVKFADACSRNGLLQRVDHEADVWYVGVYQPGQPLGSFLLNLNDIQSTPLSVDSLSASVDAQLEGTWRYFRVQIPDDPNLLGWHLNLLNVSGSATPKITVRRDRLPPSSTTVTATSNGWPSGASWSQDTDFTGVANDSGAVPVNGRQFLAARGANRPLVPGTYYIGVLAGSATPSAGTPKTAGYTLQSRGIGDGYAIGVTPLALNGGTQPVSLPAPREFRYFRVTVPEGAAIPSWQLQLTPSVGELMMQVRRDSLPDFSNSAFVGENPGSAVGGGKRLKRTGAETLLLLPEAGASTIQPGNYYIVAVSEGVYPGTTALGSGAVSGSLNSATPVAMSDLGSLSATSPLTVPVQLKGGDSTLLKVSVPPA